LWQPSVHSNVAYSSYTTTATTIVVSIFVENNWFTKKRSMEVAKQTTTVVERVLKIQWRREGCERESHSDLGDNEVGI
jgi:hypothetical protein